MHRRPPVTFQTGATPRVTVILVHGRGLSPQHARALAERLELADVRFILPEADDHTWYPKSFLSPLPENEPHLSAALDRYDDIVGGLIAAGTPASSIVVAGFSQGACLTAEFLHRYPRRLAGAILWTGGLVGPDETQWMPRPVLAGMPVYLTTSNTDPFVPAARVRRTVEWLRASRALVTAKIFSERAHEVSDEEITCARNLIRATMAVPQPSL